MNASLGEVMDNYDVIKEFFINMRCTQCNSFFEESSIKILRQEHNYTVIRVVCSKCNKNIGLAIMGIDKEELKKSMEVSNESEDLAFEINDNTPISYDDVIDAHKFLDNLGSDWTKYLPANPKED